MLLRNKQRRMVAASWLLQVPAIVRCPLINTAANIQEDFNQIRNHSRRNDRNNVKCKILHYSKNYEEGIIY